MMNREPLWLAFAKIAPVALARDLIAFIVNTFPTHDEERMREYEQWNDKMIMEVSISLKDLRERHHHRIREAGDVLTSAKIVEDDGNSRIRIDVLVTSYYLEDGHLTMRINGPQVRKLADLSRYSIYKLDDFLALRGYQAKHLFEIFGGYVNRNVNSFEIPIEELKEILGMGGKYKGRNNNFKVKVIAHAIKQINEKTDLEVEYRMYRERVHTKFAFTITRKPQKDKTPAIQKEVSVKDLTQPQRNLYDIMIEIGFVPAQAKNCVVEPITKKLFGGFYSENINDLKKGDISKEYYRKRFFQVLKNSGHRI
jgi:hypothetical protein